MTFNAKCTHGCDVILRFGILKGWSLGSGKGDLLFFRLEITFRCNFDAYNSMMSSSHHE